MRDGKSLIEEFTVSKAFTLRKLLFLFLSTATFTYQVPLFTAGLLQLATSSSPSVGRKWPEAPGTHRA
jgi:hypothetical protein